MNERIIGRCKLCNAPVYARTSGHPWPQRRHVSMRLERTCSHFGSNLIASDEAKHAFARTVGAV